MSLDVAQRSQNRTYVRAPRPRGARGEPTRSEDAGGVPQLRSGPAALSRAFGYLGRPLITPCRRFWQGVARYRWRVCPGWSGLAAAVGFWRCLRGRAALNVTEDQPAHGGVHVQGLACSGHDPGEPVVKAERGEAVAHAENPSQVVDDDDGGVHGNLRAGGPVGAEVQGAVEQIAQPERGDIGRGKGRWQRPAQPAVQGGQQSEVEGEGEAVDDREPEQA